MYLWIFVGMIAVVCVTAEIAYKIEMKSYRENLQSDNNRKGHE